MAAVGDRLGITRPEEPFYQEFESALRACGSAQDDALVELDLEDGRLDGFRLNLTALLVRLTGAGVVITSFAQPQFVPSVIAALGATWELLSVKEKLSPAAVAVVALLWASKPTELARVALLERAEALIFERTGVASSETDVTVVIELLKDKGIVEESPMGLSLTEVCWLG